MYTKTFLHTLVLLFALILVHTPNTFSQDVNTNFISPDDSEPAKYGLGISNYGIELYINMKFSKAWDTDFFVHYGGFKKGFFNNSSTWGIRFNRYWDRNDEFAPMLTLVSGIDGIFDSDSEIFDDGDFGHAIGEIDLVLGAEGGYQFNPTDKLHFRLTGGAWYITSGNFYPKVTFGVAYAF